MKPTQEQAIQWAHEAGLFNWVPAGEEFGAGAAILSIRLLVSLAYEAGHKDENEALAQMIEDAPPLVPFAQNEKGMTDREKIIYDILCSDEQPPEGQHWEGFVAKKIAAALAQPEPEPVAWMDSDGFPWTKQGVECRTTPDTYTPLYTALPQREWQGLTDEEIDACIHENMTVSDPHLRDAVYGVVLSTEAKLKENNCVVLSKECYERGCAAYDDRVDEGVMVPKEKNSD